MFNEFDLDDLHSMEHVGMRFDGVGSNTLTSEKIQELEEKEKLKKISRGGFVKQNFSDVESNNMEKWEKYRIH